MKAKYGITFSHKYCIELGLDPQKTAKQLFKLPISCVRLCAYWDELEPSPHLFTFADLDQYVNLAQKHGLDITLAIGRKVPRWPEYHEPDWVLQNGRHYLEERALYYIERTINHYKENKAIVRWQVENEPFWAFGKSSYPITEEYIKQAVNLVHSLDDRPVLLTDTAEFSDWSKAIKYGDMVGVNVYPASYDDKLHRYQYPGINSSELQRKITNASKSVMIAELQAEPWGPSDKTHLPIMDRSEREKSMSPLRLNNIFTKLSGLQVGEVWLWGAEWWVWLKQQGDESMLATATEQLINLQE